MKQSQFNAIPPARQLHFADGIPTCCGCSGARGSSAFVGGLEPVDVVSTVVAIADKRGRGDGRTEADPAVKKVAANVVKMRRIESWECIFDEMNLSVDFEKREKKKNLVRKINTSSKIWETLNK